MGRECARPTAGLDPAGFPSDGWPRCPGREGQVRTMKSHEVVGPRAVAMLCADGCGPHGRLGIGETASLACGHGRRVALTLECRARGAARYGPPLVPLASQAWCDHP